MTPFKLDSLWTWIANSWQIIRDEFWDIVSWVWDRYKGWHILTFKMLTAFLSFIFLVISSVWWALQTMAEMLASIDPSQINAGSTTMLQYGVFINRFVPLTEALAGAILLFHLWISVILFRWVKSFVPTVSN